MFVVCVYYPEKHGGCGSPWGEPLGYTANWLKASRCLVKEAITIADGWREYRGLQNALVKTVRNTPLRDGLEINEIMHSFPDEAIITGKIDGERVTIRLCIETVEEI